MVSEGFGTGYKPQCPKVNMGQLAPREVLDVHVYIQNITVI